MPMRPVFSVGVLCLVVALAIGPRSLVLAQVQPLGATPVDRALIEDLVSANHILADQQVLDAYGHVSIRHPANPQRFLMGQQCVPCNAKIGSDSTSEGI